MSRVRCVSGGGWSSALRAGGLLFSRSLFTHKANKGEDAIMDTLTTLTSSSLSSRLFGRRSAGEEEEARIAASEEFSKEVLSD